MQTTEKLQMNLFEDEDPVLAERFNENTQIIETALAKRGIVTIGSYVGIQTTSPLGVTLTFEKKPFLVFVSGYDGHMTMVQGADVAFFNGSGAYEDKMIKQNLTWEGNSVTWNIASSTGVREMNDTGKTYYYAAILLE